MRYACRVMRPLILPLTNSKNSTHSIYSNRLEYSSVWSVRTVRSNSTNSIYSILDLLGHSNALKSISLKARLFRLVQLV